jgi:hypothetical protein
MVLERDDQGQADDGAVDDARDLERYQMGFERTSHWWSARDPYSDGDARPPLGTRACVIATARHLWDFYGMPEETTPDSPGEGPPERPAVARRGLAVGLIVAASLLAFLAIFSVWVNRQFLNTDNWTATSSQMLEQPVIRDALAAHLVDELYTHVDVEAEISAALPDRAKPLAGPAASALRDLVERRARRALARPRVQQLWEDANRGAHEQLLAVLEGGGDTVSTEGGAVVLDTKALLAETQEQVGLGGRAAGLLPDSAGQITIMRSDQLKLAQDGLVALKSLPIVLVALSLALFGLALAVAPGWRRNAVRGYGLGFIAAGAAALAARSAVGDAVVGSLTGTAAAEPPVREAWTLSTTLLDQAATATIGYGLVMVIGAWLTGSTRWATAIRRALAPYMREPVFAYGGFTVVVAAVILWWAPTPATRNPALAALLVALLAIGFEAARRQTIREFPGVDRALARRRRREWLARVAAPIRTGASAGAGAVARKFSDITATTADAARSRTSATTPVAEDERLDRLERLAQLQAAGLLDDGEVRAEKTRIMAFETEGHGA